MSKKKKRRKETFVTAAAYVKDLSARKLDA
jgi:hypothetical protein